MGNFVNFWQQASNKTNPALMQENGITSLENMLESLN